MLKSILFAIYIFTYSSVAFAEGNTPDRWQPFDHNANLSAFNVVTAQIRSDFQNFIGNFFDSFGESFSNSLKFSDESVYTVHGGKTFGSNDFDFSKLKSIFFIIKSITIASASWMAFRKVVGGSGG